MDAPNSYPDPLASVPPLLVYKDRSAGLIIFGILTILLGGFCALLVPLMLVGQMAAMRTTGVPPNSAAILPGVFMYGILAVALVWLGIGSIMTRRWARALLLIFSWNWLIVGMVMLVLLSFLLPKTLGNLPKPPIPLTSYWATHAANPAPPAAMVTVVMVFTLGFFAFFFVVAPGIFAFFYGSRNVKATCEARDPVRRWTDACPLPVLAYCLLLAMSAPMMLLLPLSYHAVMPFFGTFLTGWPATILYLAVAAIFGYAAWAMYQLRPRGWWLIFIVHCLYLGSNLLTFSQHDMLEMYQLMGYPGAQIQQMQKFGFTGGNSMMWLMALCMLPWLGYLLYIKKFFRSPPQIPAS